MERFQENIPTNNFNKVFHFKMEGYCWSVVVKLFCFYNFNRGVYVYLEGKVWVENFGWRGLVGEESL